MGSNPINLALRFLLEFFYGSTNIYFGTRIDLVLPEAIEDYDLGLEVNLSKILPINR
jgi:hypothetical protein